jgi:hypothetical protein
MSVVRKVIVFMQCAAVWRLCFHDASSRQSLVPVIPHGNVVDHECYELKQTFQSECITLPVDDTTIIGERPKRDRVHPESKS